MLTSSSWNGQLHHLVWSGLAFCLGIIPGKLVNACSLVRRLRVLWYMMPDTFQWQIAWVYLGELRWLQVINSPRFLTLWNSLCFEHHETHIFQFAHWGVEGRPKVFCSYYGDVSMHPSIHHRIHIYIRIPLKHVLLDGFAGCSRWLSWSLQGHLISCHGVCSRRGDVFFHLRNYEEGPAL